MLYGADDISEMLIVCFWCWSCTYGGMKVCVFTGVFECVECSLIVLKYGWVCMRLDCFAYKGAAMCTQMVLQLEVCAGGSAARLMARVVWWTSASGSFVALVEVAGTPSTRSTQAVLFLNGSICTITCVQKTSKGCVMFLCPCLVFFMNLTTPSFVSILFSTFLFLHCRRVVL
jgi:hypothetical protein